MDNWAIQKAVLLHKAITKRKISIWIQKEATPIIHYNGFK